MIRDQRSLESILLSMMTRDLPDRFVRQVEVLAQESEGIRELVWLWDEAGDTPERAEVVADLQDAMEDRAPSWDVGLQDTPAALGGEEAEATLLHQRRAWAARLRALVEAHGGTAAVAARAGLPEAFLVRRLGNLVVPGRATLERLAEAMALPLAELVPDPQRGPQG